MKIIFSDGGPSLVSRKRFNKVKLFQSFIDECFFQYREILADNPFPKWE